ncbi:EamA family transporter [Candidatus Poribacteria bacterium]|nr:EamA family transporter [Candidatus Poribacteria bacterium]
MDQNKTLPSENLGLKAVIILLFLALFWGGNAVAVKLALKDTEPFMLAGLRFALGAVIVGLWSRFIGIELKPKRDEIIYLIILSLIFAAQIATFNMGTKFTKAGRASLFINTHPFFVAVLAHYFIATDRLSVGKIVGLLLAFGGVLIVFRDDVGLDRTRILGDSLVLISGGLLGILAVYTKRIVQNISAYKLLFWEMIFALVPFFGLSLIFEAPDSHNFTSRLFISIAYQGIVVASFCFVAWTLILKRYSASKASAFLFSTPLFGVGLSKLILDEPVTPYLIVGVILVAAGIYVVNRGFKFLNGKK